MIDKEKTALFIGNRDCYQVKEADIEQAIITAIVSGITIFLNGGQGYFDKTCAVIVHRLKKNYPHINNILVIPYRDLEFSMTVCLMRSSIRLNHTPFRVTPTKAEVPNATDGRSIIRASRSAMSIAQAALKGH